MPLHMHVDNYKNIYKQFGKRVSNFDLFGIKIDFDILKRHEIMLFSISR